MKFDQLPQLTVVEGAGVLEQGRLVGAVHLAQTTLVHAMKVGRDIDPAEAVASSETKLKS